MADKVTVDLTTVVGTLCFPHLFTSTKSKNDKGEDVYDVQILIPKTEREGVRAIIAAIKTVGQSKWGDNWKKVRAPLRDGDKEAGDVLDDGTTKGDKYPERAGHYFLNARSSKPVGVFDRKRVPITEPDAVYGGCKGRISVTFYAYSTNGNSGVAAGLNGVQKIADGEPFGGGRPSVESMFDILDDEDEFGEDEFEAEAEEPTPPPAKKAAAKKAAPAKKAAAKRAAPKPAPEPEPEEESLEDEFEDLLDGEEEDLYADLED